jgi:hypothetical protein
MLVKEINPLLRSTLNQDNLDDYFFKRGNRGKAERAEARIPRFPYFRVFRNKNIQNVDKDVLHFFSSWNIIRVGSLCWRVLVVMSFYLFFYDKFNSSV